MTTKYATRNWDKVWVVSDKHNAWKLTDPGNTINLSACGMSMDTWMDKMEAKGFEFDDLRCKPTGNVWN